MRLKSVITQPLARMALLAVTLGAPALAAQAETVAIPLGQQGKAWDVQTPRHGVTKSQVEAEYGAPISAKGPVGEPPIYTWEYEQFDVYFEGDRVIHAVVKMQK